MFVVHFFESKNPLLCQLLKQVPSVGEELVIKGRKGKVTIVESVDEKTVHVQLSIETAPKSKSVIDPSKKKKR